MGYVELDEELAATPFFEVLTVCNYMLEELGFKYSFISWAFVNKSKIVIMSYSGDNEFRVFGNNWDLTLKKGGNVMQFFTDFLSHVAIKQNGRYVDPFASLEH